MSACVGDAASKLTSSTDGDPCRIRGRVAGSGQNQDGEGREERKEGGTNSTKSSNCIVPHGERMAMAGESKELKDEEAYD
jgi:hypothetical protein